MSAFRAARTVAATAVVAWALIVGISGSALAAEDLDCGDVALQEQAPAVLDADAPDPPPDPPSDPEWLDGVACAGLPGPGEGTRQADVYFVEDATTGAPGPTPGSGSEMVGLIIGSLLSGTVVVSLRRVQRRWRRPATPAKRNGSHSARHRA